MGLKDHAVGDGGTARVYALLNYNYLIFPVTLITVSTGKYTVFSRLRADRLVPSPLIPNIGGSAVQGGPIHRNPGLGRLQGQ